MTHPTQLGVSQVTYTYGDKPHWYRPAPKPTNFDALTNAWDDDDQFAIEAAHYRDQCNRAGINPGRAGNTP